VITTLYRFYDGNDRLLYVGISGNPARRHHEHSKEKPWWSEVARSTMEHFPTREQAAQAECIAIRSEMPVHNIMHNRSQRPAEHASAARSELLSAECEFETLKWGTPRRDRLVLMPEINLTPCVDDVYGEYDDPEVQGFVELDYWFDYLRRSNDGVMPDEVSIYWSVGGDNTCETAPFGHLWGNRYPELGDFLTHFTWPLGVDSCPINFLRLPIKHRFPRFASALGWQPAPLQPTCPVSLLYDAYAAARGAGMARL
jgi:hypothetical protein